MSERNDYQLLRRNVRKGHDRMSRIENVVGVGTPDVNFCSEGCECWIEMKSPIEPKRRGTRLFSGQHSLSQAQMNWFLAQRNAGGRGYILICTDKRWMLIDGEYADEVNLMTADKLMEISTWAACKPIQKVFWNLLRKALRR